MIEVRNIKSDCTRVLHQRLCALIDPGKNRRLKLDTLCGYIWPQIEGESVSSSTGRKRYQRAREALGELLMLSAWSVRQEGKYIYLISRLKYRCNSHKVPLKRSQSPAVTVTC